MIELNKYKYLKTRYDVSYKNKFIRVEDLWFYEDLDDINESIDKVIYYQSEIERENSKPFYTLVIDLKEEEEMIFNNFSKSRKRDIKAALKTNKLFYKSYLTNLSKKILDDFFQAESTFSRERNLTPHAHAPYQNYVNKNNLFISTISTEDGTVLTWHSMYINGKRARALQNLSFLASDDKESKTLTSFANRLHHWENMKFLKEFAYEVYDFGGWYAGNEDKKLLGINEFKEKYNGVKEKSYNLEKCLTYNCHIFNFLAKLKSSLKR